MGNSGVLVGFIISAVVIVLGVILYIRVEKDGEIVKELGTKPVFD